jgi:transcription initiation factor TFIIB
VSKITEFSEKCPNCEGRKIIQDIENGEIVCHDCGYVQKTDTMDRGQEWRAFTLQDRRDKPRAGAPMNVTIHDHGISSSIGYQNRDYAGKRITQEKQIQFYRLRKWNRRAKIESSNQRNLVKALGMLNQLGSEVNAPRSVTETAALVYRQTLSKGGTRGRTINHLVAASLYIGCRICEVSKSLTIISEAADISKKEAAKNYRYLHRLLDRDIPSINTANIISMLVNKIDTSGEVERLALEILHIASELKITSGKSPSGMAAASVYISCILMGEKVTQGSIATPARVTEVTIRNRYKELVDRLNMEIYL